MGLLIKKMPIYLGHDLINTVPEQETPIKYGNLGRSGIHDLSVEVYFFGKGGFHYCNPLAFNIGSILGSLPRQSLYICSNGKVFPRESTISLNRCPFSRVSPPCSSNQL